MAKVYGFDKDTAARVRGRNRREIGGGGPTGAVQLPKAGGSRSKFFRLLEDVTENGLFWAQVTQYNNATLVGDPIQVRNWKNLITGAQAGSLYLFTFVDGEWVIVTDTCPDVCTSAGDISVGSPPDGTVDSVYGGHTVSTTSINSGTLAASGLPDGLSIDSSTGEISGTPTEAGTFYVTITGTSDATPGPGTCTLTRLMVLTINEAA